MAGELFQFRIDVDGVPQINRALGVLAKRVKDLRPAWQEIIEDFAKSEETLFQRQGNVGGLGRWAPLNPDYAARKRAQGFGSKILVRTGRLKRSLTNPHHGEFISKVRPLSLTMGTRVPYAKYHQRGTSKMPRREPIRLAETTKRRWTRIIQRYLLESGQFERKNL